MAEDPRDERLEVVIRAERLAQQNTFKWGGQTRYRCPDCGFDSHSVKVIALHWIFAHPEKAYRIESEQTMVPVAAGAKKKKAGRHPRHLIQADVVRNLRGDHSQSAFARSVKISVDVLAGAEIDGKASDATILKICRYAKRKGLNLKAEDLKKNHP